MLNDKIEEKNQLWKGKKLELIELICQICGLNHEFEITSKKIS